MANKLTGLLLVGGKSSRMGEDKSQLIYRDQTPEWLRLTTLMKEFCDEVYLSCTSETSSDFDHPVIIDSGNGPLAALAEADAVKPDRSWLVIACDLPLLNRDTLAHLVVSRDSSSSGTHYLSSSDNLPEPLCSIYEANFFPAIQSAVRSGDFCPRSLIAQSKSHFIHLQDKLALMNANSPADRLEVDAVLSGSVAKKMITLRYFAQLKELAQIDSEELETSSVTPAGLFEEVKSSHQFPHKRKQIMVAINGDFAPWETKLNDGDEVVFIPPVAGG